MANHLSYDVLRRLIERRVSAAEEAGALRHLAACPRCRSEREWLERISRPNSPPTDRPDQYEQVVPFAWMH